MCSVVAENRITVNDTIQGGARRQLQSPGVSSGLGMPEFILGLQSLVALMVRNLPAVWETQVQSPHWEDPLEEGMATHPSILAWRIPWTEEPGGLWSIGSQSWIQLN